MGLILNEDVIFKGSDINYAFCRTCSKWTFRWKVRWWRLEVENDGPIETHTHVMPYWTRKVLNKLVYFELLLECVVSNEVMKAISYIFLC